MSRCFVRRRGCGHGFNENEDIGDNCIRARGAGMYLLDPGSETKKF